VDTTILDHREQEEMMPDLHLGGTNTSLDNSMAGLNNSRFWFDMYQRLKAELSRERRDFLDA